MRCIRIEFNGYKRLVSTSCNVDDRLVAFVGPNEAGKTSVLNGLSWVDGPGSDALPDGVASRGENHLDREDDDEIVQAYYRLEPTDWEALEHLDYERADTNYTYSYRRKRSGGRLHGLSPRLRRDPEPFEKAVQTLKRAPHALKVALEKAAGSGSADDDEPTPQDLHKQVLTILAKPDADGSDADRTALEGFADWLESRPNGQGKASFDSAARHLRVVGEILETEHPHDGALQILDERRPRFREFSRTDRDLPNDFNLDQAADSVAVPFKRILEMAETSIEFLQGVWADEGHRDSHLEECNDRLRAIFTKAWSQSDLTVRLKAELNLLKMQVRVVEDDKVYVSTFGERSDGLKAFVALVGFLRSLADTTPPVLLIDEAEIHLHLDAQADLVQVLQDEVQATQVFYTTHSPGCLPLDLGRGLRFVEPTDQHYSSEISHNFWDTRHPGFSSVLFKMGAAAFAFSSLRSAVLAEGAGDMILLPTLIRLATEQDTLKYQIAPRLNDFEEDQFTRNDVAANVVYLVDGDKGGRDKTRNLRRRHHVPADLIVSHPRGYAAEDYVEPRVLLDVIGDLRTDEHRASSPITLAGLPAGETIGQRIDKWFEAAKIDGPGKVAIATRLVNLDGDSKFRLTLKSGAKTRLKKVHDEMTAALDALSKSTSK